MVVIAVALLPIVFPKNSLAAVNLYTFLLTEEHSPALYIAKLQCNEEKPLNDIPKERVRHSENAAPFLRVIFIRV